MSYAKIKNDIKKLSDEKFRIVAQAEKERRDLTRREELMIEEISGAIDGLRAELEKPESSLTVGGPSQRRAGNGFQSVGHFFQAVMEAGLPSGRVDQRLYNAATGLGESVPSEGGFLVETDFSREILQNAYTYGELAKRCRKQPIGANANGIKINGVDETSRATGSRFGGVRSYWLDEASEKQASKPKFRQIELNLKKDVVLVYATDELLQDATALEGFLRTVCPQEIAFSVDDSIIRGSGAGMPLGLLNSGSLVTVSKESGQDAATIVAENVVKMVARTLGKS